MVAFTFFMKLVTCLIPGRERRKRIRTALRSWAYGRKLRRKAKMIAPDCTAAAQSWCTATTLNLANMYVLTVLH